MSFTQETFATIGAHSADTPKLYAYSSPDNVATVTGSGYFVDKEFQISEGDRVMAFLGDGNFNLVIDSNKDADATQTIDDLNVVDDLTVGGTSDFTGNISADGNLTLTSGMVSITNPLTTRAINVTTSSTTTGGGGINITASSLTTGSAMQVYSNDSDTNNRNLVIFWSDDSAAVGTTILQLQQDARVDTNFAKMMGFNGNDVWLSDGTTAEGNLTGTVGDICLNGGTGNGQMAYCDANGTNWTDM